MKNWLQNKISALLFIVFFTMCISCNQNIKKENIKVEETSRVEYLPYYNDESFTPHWLVPNSDAEKKVS